MGEEEDEHKISAEVWLSVPAWTAPSCCVAGTGDDNLEETTTTPPPETHQP